MEVEKPLDSMYWILHELCTGNHSSSSLHCSTRAEKALTLLGKFNEKSEKKLHNPNLPCCNNQRFRQGREEHSFFRWRRRKRILGKKRPLLLSLYVLMAICRPKRCTTLKKRSHNSFSLSRESSHKYTLNSHRVTFSVSIQITNDKRDLKCCRHVVVIFKRRKRNKSIYEIQVVEDNTRRIGNTKCQM